MQTSNIFNSIRAGLIGSGSILVLSVMTATHATAQSVPADCTGSAAPGGTIDCTDPVINPLFISGSDLTVNVGSTAAPTTISAPFFGQNAVVLLGDAPGDLTFNQLNANSEIDGYSGIRLFTNFDGNLTVNTEGTVIGRGFMGIGAQAQNGDVNITANNVIANGALWAIFGRTENGNTTITTNGEITSTQWGIVGVALGGDVNIVTNGVVTGADLGISGFGDGDINITATEDVTGDFRWGIGAENEGGATTINAVNVYSGFSDAIIATSSLAATDITINTTGEVVGNQSGIIASNFGVGTTNINVADVTGTFGVGILANLGADTTGLNIATTGTVTGESVGILAQNFGTVGTTMTIGGAVSAISGPGIVNISEPGLANTITLNSGAMVSSGTGEAILDFDGDTSVVANDGSVIVGSVVLGDGSDSVTISGGADISGVTVFDGGDDLTSGDGQVDSFNVAGASLTGDILTNWELVNFISGSSSLSGTLETELATVMAGASLDLTDNVEIIGNLQNDGTMTIAGGAIGAATVDGDFTQTSTGTLVVDTQGEAVADVLNVTGTANLGGTLIVNQNGFIEGRTRIINASSLNGTFDNTDLFGGGLLLSQTLDYEVGAGDVFLSGAIVDAATVAGLTPNQIAVGNALIGDFASDDGSAALNDLAIATGTLGDADSLAKVLEELHPEEFIAGLQSFQSTQNRFTRMMTDRATGANSELDKTISDDMFWANVQYESGDQTGTYSGVDYETDGYQLAAGISNVGWDKVSVGVAFGYADKASDIGGLGVDTVDSQTFHLGGNMRADFGGEDSGLLAHVDAAGTFGVGENDIDRVISAPAVSFNDGQTAAADIDGISSLVRFTVDGSNGKQWPVKPFVQFSTDTLDQEAVSIGSGAAALDVEDIEASRRTIGAGAAVDLDLSENIGVVLRGTGLFHSGDTDTAFYSSFASSGNDGNRFMTVGEEVDKQYIIEGSLVRAGSENGLMIRADGFAEFGDLEGFGARLNIGHRF